MVWEGYKISWEKEKMLVTSNRLLDWSKLKAYADDKLNVTKKFKFLFGRVQNIVGKGENASYQHLLLFTQCFQQPFFSRSFKVGIVW